MSQAGEEIDRSVPAKEIALYDDDDAAREFEWADLRSAVDWFRNNRVLVAAVVLIVAGACLEGAVPEPYVLPAGRLP